MVQPKSPGPLRRLLDGLYALSGRVTAFIAPALIAATTAITSSQRLGVAPVILLFLLGLALLYFVEPQPDPPGDLPR